MKRLAAALSAAALLAAGAACFGAFWRREPQEPPEWSGPFNPADYRAFADLVRTYFRARGVEVTVKDGYATVAGGGGRYGLQNLAQVCSRQDRREWPASIARHFATLQQAESEHGKAAAGRSLREAMPLLAVRLWPIEYLEQVRREHVVCREDLPGTVTVLVYDLPETIQQVQPAEIAPWDKAESELFALGIDNLRRKPRPEIRRVELPGGVKVTVLSGNSYFVASEALRLDHFPGATGRHGALVGVPNRHVLLSYPVEGPDALKAMPLLVPIILGMHRDGPGSISPSLYWYHDGVFALVPYGVKEKKLQFAMPEGLAARLGEGGRTR